MPAVLIVNRKHNTATDSPISFLNSAQSCHILLTGLSAKRPGLCRCVSSEDSPSFPTRRIRHFDEAYFDGQELSNKKVETEEILASRVDRTWAMDVALARVLDREATVMRAQETELHE